MTIEEKIKAVMKKFPDVKSNEEFMWHYAETFYGVTIYMMKQQFLDFWKEGQIVEGQISAILEDMDKGVKGYKIPKFKDTLNDKDRDEYEHIFGLENY